METQEATAVGLASELRKIKNTVIRELESMDAVLEKLEGASDEARDWVSVKTAAELLGVSTTTIYDRMNRGEFEERFVGSRRFIRRSQVLAVNDKYAADGGKGK